MNSRTSPAPLTDYQYKERYAIIYSDQLEITLHYSGYTDVVKMTSVWLLCTVCKHNTAL